jgi:hypothetical protein
MAQFAGMMPNFEYSHNHNSLVINSRLLQTYTK